MRIRRSLSRRLVALVPLFLALSGQPGSAASHESYSATNASARAVLLELAKRFDANLALPDDLRGTVTVSLHGVTIDQALLAILSPLGYTYQHRSGVFVVLRAASQGMPLEGRTPTVFPVTFITADRAATALRSLFPEASVRVDHASNAVIVSAAPADVQALRNVLQSLDVRNPLTPTVESMSVRTIPADRMAERLKNLYPGAQFSVISKQTLLVKASPADLGQIKTLVASIDTPPPQFPQQLGSTSAIEGVKITQARPSDVARALAHDFPKLKVGVAGSSVVLSGTPEDVNKAKGLIAQIDTPSVGSKVTQIYRIRTLDASSVGDLIAKSFPGAQVTIDKDLNAISVTATVQEQQRISDGIAQLEGSNPQGPGAPGYNPGITAGASTGTSFEIVTLRSAVPTQGQAGGLATDTASAAVIQTLQQLVPGVRVSALSTPGQIAMIGDPYSLRLAKEFLAKLDVPAPLVILDTEILEIDESTARNLGILLGQPVISTTFTEVPPLADANTGVSRLIGIGAITRTPLSLAAQLNLQIQRGTARVLADPRITTLSGHTATIRAGDTIGILTTVGGGAGTYATSQIQTFQTGVTLDITPIVTPDNEVTVALHPVVNSLSGILNGVPQISTRDTQTTVHLKDNQTLIIGGLIQENSTRTENKVPILGDLPLIGSVFRNVQSSSTRNELIIVVTPHVLIDGEQLPPQGPPLPSIPTPRPLPTLFPGARLPSPTGALPRTSFPAAATPTPLLYPMVNAVPTPQAPTLGSAVVFGQIPPSNVANPTDPVRIFYASLGPATLSDGVQARVRAVTATNAIRVTLTIGSFTAVLTQLKAGDWSTTFPWSRSYVIGQPTVQATIAATSADGTAATVSLLPIVLQ